MEDDPTTPIRPADPAIPPGETEVVHEVERTRVIPPADPVVLPGDADVMHEQERTRVLADGTRVREVDRVEQHSRMRERLPWILIALLLVLIVGGFAVWYFTRSSTKPVPAVVGLRIDNAVTRLQADGFKVQITRQSNARPPGVVFRQDPAGTVKADSGSTVLLLVSNGPSSTTVPNAVGLRQSEARSQIVQAGFAVTTAQVVSAQPTGTVVAQDPAAGEKVAPGSKVRLNVSKGPARVDVPSEVGSTVDQAQSDLAAAGLKPLVTRVPSDQPLDTVVAQTPSGGQVQKGSTVRLNVSQGPPTATTTQSTMTTTVPASTTPTTTSTTP